VRLSSKGDLGVMVARVEAIGQVLASAAVVEDPVQVGRMRQERCSVLRSHGRGKSGLSQSTPRLNCAPAGADLSGGGDHPSIPQVLGRAMRSTCSGLGIAMVLAFTGPRWQQTVAVPIGNGSFDGQCMKINRTASEPGGRRDVREDLKTRVAECTVMIPDIAMPAVCRLAACDAPGRAASAADGGLYCRLINGDRSGCFGHAMWRR
jgi:hypothetical protein